jgi:hypothetical protein
VEKMALGIYWMIYSPLINTSRFLGLKERGHPINQHLIDNLVNLILVIATSGSLNTRVQTFVEILISIR